MGKTKFPYQQKEHDAQQNSTTTGEESTTNPALHPKATHSEKWLFDREPRLASAPAWPVFPPLGPATPVIPPPLPFAQRLSRTARVAAATAARGAVSSIIRTTSAGRATGPAPTVLHNRSASINIPQTTVEQEATEEAHNSDLAVDTTLTDDELQEMLKKRPAMRKIFPRYFTSRGYLRKAY
ncbi:hypothetical protein BP00DRAFT_414853 [Aspergillus indologenus CBS 114.80]|uniref:Uncharacterized protein n=1 Tax=Aspergillus indologenus CBS 114.80 TaxID=1450541 RepID=A0A2V5I693_9EURO|nr:hypothetical protein BP00DRAFT_414853 [Aspergillus indologenus CBS 114.80]